jgi:succinate-semialdehyde dehydrogenase/glutarate-semialdehyde dehydrogenase
VTAVVASLPAHTDLLVGGRWGEASDGARFEIVDPATGEVIASVASASVADAERAVDAAREALPGWAGTSPRHRSDVLRRAFDLLTQRSEQFARLISLENGKALADARGEVSYAAEFFRWYSEEAVRVLGSVQTAPAGTTGSWCCASRSVWPCW